jgi:hypothetical protein
VVLALLRHLVNHRDARVRRLWARYVHRLHTGHGGRDDRVLGVDRHLNNLLSFKGERRDGIPAYGWNCHDLGIQVVFRRDVGYPEMVETYAGSVRKL